MRLDSPDPPLNCIIIMKLSKLHCNKFKLNYIIEAVLSQYHLTSDFICIKEGLIQIICLNMSGMIVTNILLKCVLRLFTL